MAGNRDEYAGCHHYADEIFSILLKSVQVLDISMETGSVEETKRVGRGNL